MFVCMLCCVVGYLLVLVDLNGICVWIGFCFVSFDGLLLFGEYLVWLGVWFVVGYEGFGVMIVLGSVWFVVVLMVGEWLFIEIELYLLGCFLIVFFVVGVLI